MKKKSSILLTISIILIIVLGSTSLSIVSIVQTVENDAKNINDLGMIRGSIQRLVKLEISDVSEDDLISRIDSSINFFLDSKAENINDSDDMTNAIRRIADEWHQLTKAISAYRNNPTAENKSLMLKISEELWIYTDNAVLTMQRTTESRIGNFKTLFPLLIINLLLIITITMLIKKYVRDQLETRINLDPLTKAYNRHFFYQSLKREIERAERYGRPLTFIILDIDFFKKVNDFYGHDVGDAILKELCRVCKINIRKNDMLARIGGEEFAIIAPETGVNLGVVLAEKIRKVVENHNFEKVPKVTISLGVTEFISGDTIDDIYKRADIALYKAKNSGRNKLEVELSNKEKQSYS